MEQDKLMQLLYDQLFELITYQPANGKNPFTEEETFIHFAKNSAINPSAFSNLRTPLNPLGDLKQAEMFSRMVDVVSPMTFEWNGSGSSLLDTYKNIVDGANTDVLPAEKAWAKYEKACNYLLMDQIDDNPFFDDDDEDEKKKKPVVNKAYTPVYERYEENMRNYLAAITKYKNAHIEYLVNLKNNDPLADDKWQAKAPELENDMDASYRKLIAENGKTVEQALAIMRTTINGSIRLALTYAQDAVSDRRLYTSNNMGKWALSYPVPENWASDEASGFTKISINGSDAEKHTSERHHDIETGIRFLFWHINTGGGGNVHEWDCQTKTEKMSISAEIAKVEIKRPWFMESLFRLENWYVNTAKASGISNGKISSSNHGILPMYPVAFIVAKNVEIKGGFTEEDTRKIAENVNAGMSFGFGPFTFGGKYRYGNTNENVHVKAENGTLTIPGMQIIAWVSRVTPDSPKMNAPE